MAKLILLVAFLCLSAFAVLAGSQEITDDKPQNLRAMVANGMLLNAAAGANIESIRSALAKGADVNCTRPHGETPLIVAVEAGDSKCVDLLIGKGANVALRDRAGRSALDFAAYTGNRDAAKLILARGMDLNDPQAPATPLIRAVRRHNLHMAEWLIEKGADLRTKDNQKMTALDSAAGEGDKDLVVLLISKGANRKSDKDMALARAISSGRVETATTLIDQGADVNARGDGGATPLMRAVLRGDRPMVQMLIARGAQVDMKDADGLTVLGFARERGMLELAELLVSKGAKDPGSRTSEKWTQATEFSKYSAAKNQRAR